jgi:hypothetical protein
MTLGDTAHPEIVAEALRELKQEPALPPDDYQLLAGGISGSFVYEVRLAEELVVLKVTLPTSAPTLLTQARREAAFYEHLAPRVPLHVPRLLRVSDSKAGGVSILLSACQPALPPPCWADGQYTEIAAQLGQLHGRFWGNTDRLWAFRWLRPAPHKSMSVRSHRAIATWRSIKGRDDLDDGAMPGRLRAVLGLLPRLPALRPPPPLPTTLCHGDCHPDNILRGQAGEWVWADWQAVRIGQGPEDLAFFWQRAEVVGGAVPREQMLSAYQTGLAAEGADAPTTRQLVQAVAWAEFTSWLLEWPPFLVAAAAPQLGYVLDRIDDLVEQLEIGAAD